VKKKRQQAQELNKGLRPLFYSHDLFPMWPLPAHRREIFGVPKKSAAMPPHRSPANEPGFL
jgi:hypothetical protein